MGNLGKKRFAKATLLLFAVFTFTCSNESSEIDSYFPCESDSIGFYNSIAIIFNNGSEPMIDNPYENEIAIMLNGENVIVQNLSTGTEYNLIVSGATKNGSLKIYGNNTMGLYLNGANITNPNGPAINIQNHQKISIHMVGGTENSLADGISYEYVSGEDAKGTLFSEGPIRFSGCGSLTIAARYAHAIAVDNDFEIESGKITVVEAVKDGIHANDYIYVKGGTINITSNGDGIQSENSSVHISGGKIIVKTTGIKSHGIKANGNVEISGGMLIVKALGDGSKGINVNGNLAVSGGDIKIEANDDGIKVHGNMLVNNGNICIWSFKKQDVDCVGTETIKSGTVNSDKCVVGF